MLKKKKKELIKLYRYKTKSSWYIRIFLIFYLINKTIWEIRLFVKFLDDLHSFSPLSMIAANIIGVMISRESTLKL